MTPELVYLGLGSNLGDRRQNLESAIQALPPRVRVLRRSAIYRTPPWGYTEQPEFLNMALEAQTELSPEALLEFLKQIELQLGRQPSFLYGPRQIDLDILFYGERILHSQRLTIPHPRLHERAFVLVPLAELAPDFIHPVLGVSVAALLARVDPSGVEVAQ